MPPFSPNSPKNGLVGRLDAGMLYVLTQPPASRSLRVAVAFGGMLFLGWIDYVTGPSLSLQVFYLAPILLALAWLGVPAALFASVCSVAVRVGGDYVLGAEYTRRPTLLWNSLGHLAIYCAVVWAVGSLLRLRRELEQRVVARSAELAEEILTREQLQRELIEISERERRTIGNDLHDGLGQHLTAMAYAAQVLTHQLAAGDKSAADTAREIGRLAEEGILQSRQLARGLLLTAIEPRDLQRELQELATLVQRQTGVRCQFRSAPVPLVRDSSTASHLFRIAQEAVRNALRHAQPHTLDLSLAQEDEAVVLTVSDDGAGLPPAAPKERGVGLRVMAHRAKLIGGDFKLESDPGHGTRIQCRVPLGLPPAAVI
ncbi:MAG TPA: sensor histidine kinase [Lacunisphaera sp.]|nr:sensor histidine kinase [Lacunisphaera sp.]